MDWQPIETAPKDGTRIFLFFPEWRHSVQPGHWLDSKEIRYGKIYRESAQWIVEGSAFFSIHERKLEPTHWMPLPDPPKVFVKSDMEVA